MAGTAINSAPASGMDTTTLTPSLVNSYRISAVADRLATHIRNTHQSDIAEFFNLCLDLARGIDYAIANNDVPSRAQDLPLLLKQVCQHKYDSLLQAVIMVLMISVKNACRRRWFTDKDSDELQTLANEIKSSFCIARDINTEASSFLPTVSTIMSRFYPRMKMGQVLAFLEVKSGYGAFVIDFHIPKDAKSSPEDKIRLFVAQTDNIESSSCLISPLHVNFLLNGKGVERRTNVIMDTGPQIPTIVTHMLKYGTNLLQAVGQFNGNYVIVVAFMSMISTPLCPALQDYVQPAVTILDSDSEIIEGPSRISLNCPISFRRIKTPVKGHSCKHLPCFDLDNFVDINSRRPSWRCPYCNQYVCFTEIRIDRNMAKVLEEAGENVTDVIISADGSWKAVMECDEHTDKLHQKTQQEHTSLSNGTPDTMDLTEDDEMDAIGNENEDTKPFPANFQTQPCVNNLTINPAINNTSAVNQDTASHMEGDFWSGIYLSTFGSGTSGARSNAQIGGILESDPTNLMSSPVLTDAISPTLLATSVEQNQVFAPNYMQLQQFGNSNMSNEYGMFPSIPRHVNRTPIAVQALAAQTPTPVPQQRSRTSLNSQTSPTLPLVMDAFNNLSNHVEMQQQFSRSHSNPPQTSHLTASSLQQLMGLQNWDGQGQSFISSQPTQQISGLRAPSHLASAHRVSSSLLTELQNLNPQQPLNPRMPHAMSQSPSLIQSSAQARTQIHQGGTHCGIAQRRSPSMPVPVQTSRASSPFSVNADGSFRAPSGGTTANPNNGLVDLPTEQNWRPAGRMRGALSGQAYSAAFNQYIIQVTQAAQQAAGPLSNMNSPTPNVPSQLHVLAANLRNAHAPQPVNFPSTEPAGMAGGLGFHPR